MVPTVATQPRKTTQGAAQSQTSPPPRTAHSDIQTPSRLLPLHRSGMPLAEWNLTAEELDAFGGPVQLSSSDSDSSGSSEVEVHIITSESTPNTTVENIVSPDHFAAAHERNLHGTLVSPLGMEPEGPAYVVFRGQIPGVYLTWFVPPNLCSW